MKVGFTGTRKGVTQPQWEALEQVLLSLPNVADEFHHGDCVGADAEADEVAHDLGLYVVIHPPVDEALRAFCRYADETRPAKTHFARNRDIVNETEALVATPGTMEEEAFGGTWYTINYARKRGKPIVIVWPDGSVTYEGWPTRFAIDKA